MRSVLIILALLLAACDSPSPWLASGTQHAITLEGIEFTVWQKGDQVEIIRHGFLRPKDQRRIRPLMQEAARRTTGCDLRPGSVEGDTGVLRARLDCRA